MKPSKTQPVPKTRCLCWSERGAGRDVIRARRWASVCWPPEWADFTSPRSTTDL